jgi:hypothetical protein
MELKLSEHRTGSVFPAAERRTSVSIGPLRNGVFIAKLWRIWSRGDEFYAANRDAVPAAKVSFHSSGNWQLDVDQQRWMLGPPLALSLPGWSLALQLKFLVRDAPMESPVEKKFKNDSNAIGAETPVGLKLLVNLLVAPVGTQLTSDVPPAMDGVRILAMRLRSQGTVVVTASTLTLDVHDLALIDRVGSAKIGGTSGNPHKATLTAEFIEVNFKPSGNVINVVPFAKDSFQVAQPA